MALYSICQRYNFESNLQHHDDGNSDTRCCIRYVKDTILKAIYNITSPNIFYFPLYSICQRYNFESNLQPVHGVLSLQKGCIRYVKDTILKAIYNKGFNSIIYGLLYSICQRYNFESNLQQDNICIE